MSPFPAMLALMAKLHDLPTPAAVVDLDVLERNCAGMRERARGLGVTLRPHVKTHKSVEIARLQVGDGPSRVTVSTLAEAALFAAAGFDDLTWAVPVPLQRIDEALDVAESVGRLNLLLDHEDTRVALDRAALGRRLRVPVFLKVDCGYHRAGVDPEAPGSVALARRVAESPGLELAGVLTHGGHGYGCLNRDAIAVVAAEERDVTAGFAARLRDAGIEVPVVSVGSTPTCSVVDHLAGVDEIRPGNYAFFDVYQAAIGACSIEDVALTVLGTVIGCYPERGTIVLDTGGTALSHDPGPRHVDPECGYGIVVPIGGGVTYGSAPRIVALSQEHAKVVLDADVARMYSIGDRVRVLPNHACMAAGMFDRYHVVRGDAVVDRWGPAKYWSADVSG